MVVCEEYAFWAAGGFFYCNTTNGHRAKLEASQIKATTSDLHFTSVKTNVVFSPFKKEQYVRISVENLQNFAKIIKRM